MNFAYSFKKIRNDRNLTQKQMAQLLGVTQQTISQYENGQSTPKSDMILKLADRLEVSVAYLLGNTGDLTQKEFPEDVIRLLQVYESLPMDKKSMSIELLKVLRDNTEQDGKNGK